MLLLMQVVERNERDEENASIQLSSKTAKGRKMTKKTGVAEDTKPSVHGRRVEPAIHQKFKAAAAVAAKKRKLKEVSGKAEFFWIFVSFVRVCYRKFILSKRFVSSNLSIICAVSVDVSVCLCVHISLVCFFLNDTA